MSDDTPVRTPSGLSRLGLSICPVCDGLKVRDGEDCVYCTIDGVSCGRVTLERYHLWVGLKPTDPAPPDIILTDPEDD